jgi:hypothetical protein
MFLLSIGLWAMIKKGVIQRKNNKYAFFDIVNNRYLCKVAIIYQRQAAKGRIYLPTIFKLKMP